MATYRAGWLLPIAAPPVRGGWVRVDHGRIEAWGGGPRADAEDLGPVALLPSLVNAHAHLELSYLRGAVPPATRLVDWVRDLQARREPVETSGSGIRGAAQRALSEARASGTGLIGDVTNSLLTTPLLADGPVRGRVFFELVGFRSGDPVARIRAAEAEVAAVRAVRPPDAVRISLAPHAPYSVSPGLFEALRRHLDASDDPTTSVHLGESPEELEFLARGTGPWRQFLEEVDAWDPAWEPHGGSPVEYLSSLGFLAARLLAVHAVQLGEQDLARLRRAGATLVMCPRSNRHVGLGWPPLARFYASGADVAVGTDSLASAPDLNVFAELAAARRAAPDVPAARMLESATIVGARALGFERAMGTIEVGKRASLIAVGVPAGVSDVEEYLLSGVSPSAVRWVAG